MIGTGASAFQLVPEVAKQASRLIVFQRSPPWMVPNPRYHARVSEAKKWLLRHVPYYARWYRFLLFWPGSDGLMPSLVVDPEWPHPERSVNAVNDVMREFFTQYMAQQIGDDPELLAKVVPTLPAVRQAHAAGQRHLAGDAEARQRRPGHRADRRDHAARRALRRRHASTRST